MHTTERDKTKNILLKNMKIYEILKRIDKKFGFETASAHCDIPCGIYDPHRMQLAAHTMIRMTDLINETKKNKKLSQEERIHAIARYSAVKETHGEDCKNEIRILWGDYFKEEHAKNYPELTQLVWNSLKLASKARQTTKKEDAVELLHSVQKIAEIFWKTKNRMPVRAKAPYNTGEDIILHD